MSLSGANRVEKPTLQGQRIKTRKRDEKEKYDPAGFRDSIITGISEIVTGGSKSCSSSPESEVPSPTSESAGTDPPERNGAVAANAAQVTKARLDALSKWLDERGNKKDDYRKYGEVLFDVLIAGGILAPGGNIIVDRETDKTDFCVFRFDAGDEETIETIRGFSQVFQKLVRRYKYLEKTLDEEFKKIIKFLKGFTAEERDRLAKLTAVLITSSQVPVSVITSAIHDQSVKDGYSADFLLTTLRTWLLDRDSSTVWTAIRKAGIDQKVLEFFPANKRSAEYLDTVFQSNGLSQLLEFQKAGLGDKAKKELHAQVVAMIKDESSVKEIESFVKDAVTKNGMPEHEVAVLLWNTLMNGVEWNKKEELVAEQAIKHLKVYAPLLEKFTTTVRAEIALINRVQEFSYENMNFLKVFSKIIQLFYKMDVVSEDAVLKWFKESHSAKGKSVFLDQTKQFVEWLQNADEESE